MKLSDIKQLDELTSASGSPDSVYLYRDPDTGTKYMVDFSKKTWCLVQPDGSPSTWTPLEAEGNA